MIPMSSPDIGDREVDLVSFVIRSGVLASGSGGPMLRRFERMIEDFVGAKHAIGVSSGTAGLHLALLAAGIRPGDEVITTPFSFIASTNCILYAAALPIFVDIHPTTFNIDSSLIEDAITPRTKAILPVHIFHQPCNMDTILAIAKEHSLAVIEDACEALGATYKNSQAGTLGDLGVYAFYPNKIITTGEGGMIVTDNDDYAALLRSLRNQGRDDSGTWLSHVRLGYNYRMDEMSAAIGLAQMEQLETLLAKREQVARWYTEKLGELSSITLPWTAQSTTRNSWWVYVIRLHPSVNRRRVTESLSDLGIPTRPYFPPIHLQPYMLERFAYRSGMFPVTERVGASTLALPFSSIMSKQQVEFVCANLEEVLQ